MSNNIQAVSVFCASRFGFDPIYKDVALNTGKMLAQEGILTIYGGGGSGLMGAVAQGAEAAGGQVRGIMPELFRSSAEKAPSSVDTYFTPDMAERKHCLIADSNVVIVLPGGIGTFDEIFETIMFNYLEIIQSEEPVIRPLLIIDPDNLYEPLTDMLQRSIDRGLTDASVLQTLFIVPTVEAARAQLQIWQNEPLKVSLEKMPEMTATTSPSGHPALLR
ncbi:MAG: TIGR00730 family Rossman fold protein [Alphaproteobacteria bacterium]|nr:TIGR00730 family Rossman fold protein [Alphaproteobacteria bacterium]